MKPLVIALAFLVISASAFPQASNDESAKNETKSLNTTTTQTETISTTPAAAASQNVTVNATTPIPLEPFAPGKIRDHSYIDSSRAVYRISLSFIGPQMNR